MICQRFLRAHIEVTCRYIAFNLSIKLFFASLRLKPFLKFCKLLTGEACDCLFNFLHGAHNVRWRLFGEATASRLRRRDEFSPCDKTTKRSGWERCAEERGREHIANFDLLFLH